MKPRSVRVTTGSRQPDKSLRFRLPRLRVGNWTALLFSALFIGGTIWYQATTYINPDVGWLLHMARSAANGSVPYRDLIEVNPPLVLWLLSPVVYISEHSGAPLPLVSRLAVGLLALGATAWSLWLLNPKERWPALPVLILLFVLLPGMEFGQREHLMMMLLAPFLCLVVRRVRGERASTVMAVLVGVAAALGFALKPQYGLIWVGVALYLTRHMGLREFLRLPETLTLIVAAPVYLFLIVVFTPEYWEVVGQLGELYLGYIHVPAWVFLLQPALIAAMLGVGAWVIVRRRMVDRTLPDVLAIAAVGAVVGAIVQGKGFSYHFLPALILSIALPCSVMKRWRPLTATACILLALPSQIVFQQLQMGWSEFNDTTSSPAHLDAILKGTVKPGDRVTMLNWWVRDSWPMALRLGESYTYPMPSIWWLHALHPMQDPDDPPPILDRQGESAALERSLFELTVRNLIENNPAMLVLPRGSGGLGTRAASGRRIDVVRYLSQDDRMRRFFSNYSFESEYGRYAIWRRGDAQGEVDPRTP